MQFSVGIEQCILSSELGPEIFFELAKNQKEFDRVNALDPIRAAVEIGKIEAKILLAKESSKQKQETKKQTQAPPPIKTLSSSSAGHSSNDPDKMSYQEYKKWREAHG